MRGRAATMHRRGSRFALAAAYNTRALEPRASARALALRISFDFASRRHCVYEGVMNDTSQLPKAPVPATILRTF